LKAWVRFPIRLPQ